jgi:hypothetical protein
MQLLPCNKYCKDMQELRATMLNGFYFPMKWQTDVYVTQELTPYERVYANL